MARAARLALMLALAAAALALEPARLLAQPAPGLRAPAETAFDMAIRAWMKRHAIVRASLAVMREERLVVSLGYGGRSPSERIGIWSLSKPITAACAATLIQDGRLSLDDRVGVLLGPLVAKHGPAADKRFQRITVRHLIEHRAGLPRSAGGNRFSPGMVEALRVSMTEAASVEQLLPAILKLRLARDPGVTYEYSNIGYLLLGQIIEKVTGLSYVEACSSRVLTKAGISAPELGRPWGGLLHASAGWALSGPEYLAFARLLSPRRTSVLKPAMHEWMRRVDDRWIDDGLRTAYTLGVMLRVAPPDPPYLFHSGGWVWRQDDAKSGPIHEYQWSWFVLSADGTSWFVSFSGKAGDNERRIFDDLDRALWQARRNVTAWPAHDLFPSLGIGPPAGR